MLSPEERLVIETRVGNESPSVGLAYVFWLFLGFLSGHRFYLGRPISAIVQIISYFIVIGFIWLILDLFLIPGMVRDKQDKIRRRLVLDALSGGAPAMGSRPASGFDPLSRYLSPIETPRPKQ